MATGDSQTPAASPMVDTTTPPTPERRSIAIPALALTAWTLFVWLGRIRNVAADADLEGFATIWRLGLATVFSLSALALGASTIAWLRSPDRSLPPSPLLRASGAWLAVFGIVVWTIRGTDIALGDHTVPFILVHSFLALVTAVLGVIVLRSLFLNRTPA